LIKLVRLISYSQTLKFNFMSKVLLGFLAGAAAGALAGILLAPDSGANTRKKISEKAGGWKDAAKDSLGGIIDGVKKAYSGAKEDVESKAGAVKNEVRNAMG
jgi:gas vesicle protein